MNNFNGLKIAVAGTGYVGLSMATLLSQNHHVTAVDVIPEKRVWGQRVRGQVLEPFIYNYEMARTARTHSDSGVYHAYCSPDEFEPYPE